MKRLHIHVSVADLEQSVRFYATLFAAAPTVLKPDYAKWMLDDPRVNFAISKRGGAVGVQHLGIQAEHAAELAEVYDRLTQAERPIVAQGATTCCYAKSDKQWIADPQGVHWETFYSYGESTIYGVSSAQRELGQITAPGVCCTPADNAQATPEPAPVAACCAS